MWQNFSKKFVERKAWIGIILPVWVFAGFILSEVIVTLLYMGLGAVGVPTHSINPSVLNTVSGAIIYILTLLVVIGLPWLVKKYKTSREEVGLTGSIRWADLLLAPAGFIVYILLSGLLVFVVSHVFTFIDLNQTQDTGFNQLNQQFEVVLAFLTLVIIAPLCEEIIFRGYLLGKLRQHFPTWLAILVTSALFGLVHFAWNVGIDVFALSIVLCLLRVYTKSLWPSILLHMIKNGLAFYILFINPTLLSTLGG